MALELNAIICPLDVIDGCKDSPPVACTPAAATLTRDVIAVWRSCRKMSATPLLSLATKFVAVELKAIKRPSLLRSNSIVESLPVA